MSDSINGVYVDIPYIIEDRSLDEGNLSKAESTVDGPWYSTENRNHSDSPSLSSSFRDDGTLLTRKHTVPFVFVSGQPYRTSSLNDIRERVDFSVYRSISRHRYGRRSQYSEYSSRPGSSRRKGSTMSEGRRSSIRSSIKSSRSRRGSSVVEKNRSIRSNGRRISKLPLSPPVQKNEEELNREMRHRIAVWLVLGSFIFIAVSSILVVVITLTHQSEHNYDDNNTITYYTFAKPSHLAESLSVRKENEELMNSLNRESSYNSTSIHASPP